MFDSLHFLRHMRNKIAHLRGAICLSKRQIQQIQKVRGQVKGDSATERKADL